MSRARVLIFAALPVLVADWAAKRLAVQYLQPPYTPHRVLGDAVRFTLTYNRQGVMGLPFGPQSRWLLSAVSIVVLVILAGLLRATRPGERLRGFSVALIIGGAAGNLLDRLTSSRGVVDFIDIGVGSWRYWTFNIADVAIDAGIVLLAWALWRGAGRPAL